MQHLAPAAAATWPGPTETAEHAGRAAASWVDHDWAPYLHSLPQEPAAMLLTFADPRDRAWLEYPPLEQAVVEYRGLAAGHYARCGGAKALAGADLEDFLWALAVVGSRCLGASMLMMALLAGAPDDGPQQPQTGPDDKTSRRAQADSDQGALQGDSLRGSTLPPADPSAAGELPSHAAGPLAMLLLQAAGNLSGPVDGTSGSSGCSDSSVLQSIETSELGSTAGTSSSSSSAGGSRSDIGSYCCSTSSSTRRGSIRTSSDGDSADKPSVFLDEPSRSAVGGQLRMLVPLVDMMNHRMARRTGGRLGDGGPERLVWEANVRWELRPPTRGPRSCLGSFGRNVDGGRNGSHDLEGGCDDGSHGSSSSSEGWWVVVVATEDIPTGQELLLCYDERGSNDTFALHYGFVPQLSPHDDVQLFGGLAEALEWHRAEMADKQVAAVVEAAEAEAPVGAEAFAVARLGELGEAGVAQAPGLDARKQQPGCHAEPRLDRLYEEAAQAARLAVRSGDLGEADLDAPIKLHPGGQLSPTLAAALLLLSGGRQEVVRATLSCRCEQLLSVRAPLLEDLRLLIWDLEQQQQQQQQYQPVTDYASSSRNSGSYSSGPSPSCSSSPTSSHASSAAQDSDISVGPAAAWQSLLCNYEAAISEQPLALQLLAGVHQHSTTAGAFDQTSCDNSGRGSGTLPGHVHLTRGGAALTVPLTHQQRLALKYRLHKKLLLWDHILAQVAKTESSFAPQFTA